MGQQLFEGGGGGGEDGEKVLEGSREPVENCSVNVGHPESNLTMQPCDSCFIQMFQTVTERSLVISQTSALAPSCSSLRSDVSSSGPHSTVSRCPPNEYQCGGTELCIHMSKLCNGVPDCTDGWDEGPHCRGTAIFVVLMLAGLFDCM